MNVTTMNNQAVSGIHSKPMDKAATTQENSAESAALNQAAETRATISNEGKVGSFLANLTPEQQTKVDDFVAQIHQQKTTGTFDAKSMAKEAPQSVKELSAMLNVSTEELLNHIPAEAQSESPVSEAGQTNASAIKTYKNISFQS